jgi:methylmalonyl-CoA mutase N-terminal domain/subunit
VVGVNKFVEAEDAAAAPEILRVDPDLERAQVERTRAHRAAHRAARRAARRPDALTHHQTLLVDAARGDTPLGGVIYDAVRAGLTVGEICEALRGVFGRYSEPVFL